MIKQPALIILLVYATLSGCSTQPDVMESQAQEVASYLTGVMETSAQAKAIPDAPSVRMTTCEVNLNNQEGSLERSGGIFLYQEQALTRDLKKPYRQRILQILPSQDGKTIESISFKPINPKTWIGFCNQSESKRIREAKEIESVQCRVFLTKQEQRQYMGETQPGGCTTNFKGAVKVTNTIKLDQNGMETLDRGFDSQGKQIWGAENRPYQYRRIDSKREQGTGKIE